MNRIVLCSGLSLLTTLTACAPKAITGGNSRSSASAVNYNAYNDDLATARPSYTVVTSTPANAVSAPVRTDAVVTPPAKPVAVPQPVRQTNGPAEVLYVNKRLDNLLDTIAVQNRSVRYASGYRIQIYVGNEREEADAAKLQVYQAFPELSPYLSYKQPTYRLKVGDFMRRLDAEWYLGQLKPQFRAVMLQPDKVDIRRSLLTK
ncbi:MAG: SPOR domain-containing protein [Bacteroidetes bacterium]|nr:SPOR domain-containing protein [Fibrella sp.]